MIDIIATYTHTHVVTVNKYDRFIYLLSARILLNVLFTKALVTVTPRCM